MPFAHRTHSYNLAGVFWFCLPIGLAVYGLFHLVRKLRNAPKASAAAGLPVFFRCDIC